MYHGCGESSSRRPLRDFARRSERTVLRLLSSIKPSLPPGFVHRSFNHKLNRQKRVSIAKRALVSAWARPLLRRSIMSGRLGRYKDFAWFVAKYGRADFVTKAVAGDDAAASDPAVAEAFAGDLESLGPTFIKLGQILSTRADLLPPAYLDALTRLQDHVEPFPFEEVERTIREELGVRMSSAFAEFDTLPIAAASLGQVHRAVLRGGRIVAVKVQRPGVRERVEKDLAVLREIAVVIDRVGGAYRHVDAARLVDEFKRPLMSELDYREEARNLVTIAHQLRDFEHIVIPLPVDDYTTARVLTMDYVPGAKITAVSRVEWTEIDGAALADRSSKGCRRSRIGSRSDLCWRRSSSARPCSCACRRRSRFSAIRDSRCCCS